MVLTILPDGMSVAQEVASLAKASACVYKPRGSSSLTDASCDRCSMWLFSWLNDSSHSGVYLKSFADFSAQKKVELLSPAREIKRLYDH
ncbi:hypothetical protein BHM03_00009560 [Ensete ventricosum]|nr:hypothetical protein BHM03_00009560 [Ensete ventricosum]